MQQAQLFDLQGPVAGVDEAGRGPLAGPVVAAAVILRPGQVPGGLDDSKRLGKRERDRLEIQVKQQAAAWSVAWADRAEIDALNILGATMLAMRRAILGLGVMPQSVQVDGNRLPGLEFLGRQLDGRAVVGGDGKIAEISAASVLAKTARDRIMEHMDTLYPDYRFAQHKGYPTEAHFELLRRHGPCIEHRRSFAPVRAAS